MHGVVEVLPHFVDPPVNEMGVEFGVEVMLTTLSSIWSNSKILKGTEVAAIFFNNAGIQLFKFLKGKVVIYIRFWLCLFTFEKMLTSIWAELMKPERRN